MFRYKISYMKPGRTPGMALYGISLDVYVIVLAELVGAFLVIGWALWKTRQENQNGSRSEAGEVQA